MNKSTKNIFAIAIIALLSLQSYTADAQNRIDNQGRRQGHWIKTDKDGSRIFEGEFKDGKEVGIFNYYYPDGTLKIRNTFTDPGRYCKHEAFDRQGRLLATGFYNQKNRDGEWRYYSQEGKLVKIAGYRMGIKEGTHVVFNSNGDTAEISNWKDNRRHGRWWKRIGEKGWITGRYENGLMQGRLVEYDNEGRLVSDGNYLNGEKHGAYRHYEQGRCTVEESWHEGALAERKILLNCPDERWQSVFGIAYFMPKGKSANGTIVYLNDGNKLVCNDSPDAVNFRVGRDQFVIIDRKSQLMANTGSIVGITKDSEGRDILELLPKPPFSVYPDQECLKMVKSLKRIDQLDEE